MSKLVTRLLILLVGWPFLILGFVVFFAWEGFLIGKDIAKEYCYEEWRA